MKHVFLKTSLFVFILAAMAVTVSAQKIQYYRYYDQRGINVFEPSKNDTVAFDGFKVRIGGSFTQNFQKFTSENKANYVARPTSATATTNGNYLYNVITAEDTNTAKLSGFNTAMANLNIDIQLADGIRVSLENYMSARHHNEFWVKGGYIQIDKLPMFGNPEWFSKYFRAKIGHFQPNFGDFQFRRSDGGNTIWNPFGENLILDAFTTEIGGEVYVFPAKNLMLMGGMTAGFINGNINVQPEAINSAKVVATKRNPSVFAKAAYDKQFSNDLRFRLSGSIYYNSNIQRNTLFAGDRTGSNYFGVMEPARQKSSTTPYWVPTSLGTSPSDPATGSGPNFTSGRLDPGMSNRITAISIDPFVKFKGLEVYGGFQNLKGSVYGDTSKGEWLKRSWNQAYGEVVYRIGAKENVYVGMRYITVSGEPNGMRYASGDASQGKTSGAQAKITSNRFSMAAGWFINKYMLLKAEYVTQSYNDYPVLDYRYEGNYKGIFVSAVIGF